MSEPDTYSNAWYRQQFRGVMHSLNRCNAEYASAADLIEALGARVATLEQQMVDAQATIGQLRDEIEDKVDKIRTAYKQLKNGEHHEDRR